MKNSQFPNFFLILFSGIFVFNGIFCHPLAAQHITRVDPPEWWQGMKNPFIQLLIQLDEPVNDAVNVETQPKVQNLDFMVRQPSNHRYIIVDFVLPADFKDSVLQLKINCIKNGKNVVLKYKYPIRKRVSRQNEKGVTQADFVYLLMTDRFANGDPKNDNNKQMTEPIADRKALKSRHGGDIQGIINHLDYLSDLGVTAVWPTPVFVNDQPKDSYHGYAITDHYDIDPRFGNLSTYANLKSEASKRNIKLIKDVIYNHCGNNHYLFTNPPSSDWFHQWDTFTRTNYKATTLIDPHAAEADKKLFSDGWFDKHMPDINQQNPEMANYLIQNTIWWVEKFGLNGLRIDTYSYPDQAFMRNLIAALLAEYPDLGIFGETWVDGNVLQSSFTKGFKYAKADPLLPGVTDFQISFALKHAMTTEFGWNEGLSRIYHVLAEDNMYVDPTKNAIFLDNHDLSRYLSMVGEDVDKLKMASGMLLTLRGIPCMYYGTEILMKNFSNPDALVRGDFPGGWTGDSLNKFLSVNRTAAENDYFNFVKKIANYRKQSEALMFGKLTQFEPVDGVYVYFRYHSIGKKVMVVVNQKNTSKTIASSRFAEILGSAKYGKDIISDKTYNFESNISIDAKSILIIEF